MRVGITGHQRLTDADGWAWVTEQIDAALSELLPPLIGLTSLAAGADQIFAEAILRHGGIIHAIIPFIGYEDKFPEGRERKEYEPLLKLASHVEVLKKSGTGREAYFQAGKQVVHRAELLIAVWDGLPSKGSGGTADAVEYARSCGKPVLHINPVSHDVSRNEMSER
jgi:hypothetical protein